jgi:hypothetical protein
MSEYNGWTNRETWLVVCWFEPQTPVDVDCIEEQVWDDYEALPGFFKDCIALDAINWEELRTTFANNCKEYED